MRGLGTTVYQNCWGWKGSLTHGLNVHAISTECCQGEIFGCCCFVIFSLHVPLVHVTWLFTSFTLTSQNEISSFHSVSAIPTFPFPDENNARCFETWVCFIHFWPTVSSFCYCYWCGSVFVVVFSVVYHRPLSIWDFCPCWLTFTWWGCCGLYF